MGIKQKLMMLSVMAGVVVLLISVLGYFQAYKGLRASTEQELVVVVKEQAGLFDGWLREKQRIALDEANLMTALSSMPDLRYLRESISLHKGDADVINIAYGDESGFFMAYRAGVYQSVDVHTRPWYQELMKEKKPFFTEPYEALSTKTLVVSAIAPFEDADGSFAGGICVDISMDSLFEQVRKMHYFGTGNGFLFDSGGKLIVSSSAEYSTGTDLGSISLFSSHADAILAGGTGFFSIRGGNIVAFSRIPSTNWIVCLSVPEKDVFSQLTQLRITYGGLTLFGLFVVALMFFLCTRFAEDITKSVSAIERHAHEIAKGNLALEDLAITSQDEIGSLTESFNTMRHDLCALVHKMSDASNGVARSSRDLVKYVELTAQAAEHISKLASKVTQAMVQQLSDVEIMSMNVDTAFADIDELSSKAMQIAEAVSVGTESIAMLQQDTETVLASMAEGSAGAIKGNQGVEVLEQCFFRLIDEMAGLQRQAKELHALSQTIADKTGYIIDTMGSIDQISRKTSQRVETIEASTEEQEASILEIVAAAQSLEDLATDMNAAVERFRL